METEAAAYCRLFKAALVFTHNREDVEDLWRINAETRRRYGLTEVHVADLVQSVRQHLETLRKREIRGA